MTAAGIDIGSRWIKLAVVEEGEPVHFSRIENSFDTVERCRRLLSEVAYESLVATGYGRHLLEIDADVRTVTEIKAFARGVRADFPACRMVIDIGGQDAKVIQISESGRVLKFEMNDRCAAGTGRFLEVMAQVLGYSVEELGSVDCDGVPEIELSHVCTVFAESEVVSLVAKGTDRRQIAASVHACIANRVAAMAKRLGVQEPVAFAGGCARSISLVRRLEQQLGASLRVASEPEMTGALGAALLAGETSP